jgi:hypothetical protein
LQAGCIGEHLKALWECIEEHKEAAAALAGATEAVNGENTTPLGKRVDPTIYNSIAADTDLSTRISEHDPGG